MVAISLIISLEASDFDRTVFDVENLSAIRGASLAQLEAPNLIDSYLRNQGVTFEKIYSGASNAAFKVTYEEAKIQGLLGSIRKHLGLHTPTGHLGFLLSAAVDQNGAPALQIAMSRNSVQQSQSLSWPLPPFEPMARSFDLEGDRMRPASVKYTAGTSERLVPPAFRDRHSYGFRKRRRFYDTLLNCGEIDIAEDFEDMLKKPPDGLGESVPSKIALFYADGNGLGSLMQRACLEGRVGEYSSELKGLQRGLLERIVAWRIKGDQSHNVLEDGERWRFETLLWGGDEVCFVMPAWNAMKFCRLFFQAIRGWEILGEPVTHAAGLVIAPKKSPVRQLKALAEDLAEECKKHSREKSLLQVEVFESIALPDTDLGRYRKRLHGKDAEAVSRLVALPGEDLDAVFDHLTSLTGKLPRSQLYNLLRSASPEADFETWRNRAGTNGGITLRDLSFLEPEGGGRRELTVSLGLLAELWDYLDPFATAGSTA